MASPKGSESPFATADLTKDFFLNVGKLTTPKDIKSLSGLWDQMFGKQAESWNYSGAKPTNLKPKMDELLELGQKRTDSPQASAAFCNAINSCDLITLLGIVRALHVKIHLQDLDESAVAFEKPRVVSRSSAAASSRTKRRGSDENPLSQSSETSVDSHHVPDLLNTRLIVQSFLEFLTKNGADAFAQFLNETVLRLVSTVHPNETERNVNLMHYTSVLEKYIDWRRDYESLEHLPPTAPEYRIRRERLNQVRRAIKAEIEGVWQANQRRKDAISVESEARRLLERYRVILQALPTFMKFVKGLAAEAWWLYHASLHTEDAKWVATFQKHFTNLDGTGRENKLKAIKTAFAELNVQLQPPRIVNPLITFGSWKGGDRDGNPFVNAAFTNQTFIEQKLFVLTHYQTMTMQLIDKLTTSTEQFPTGAELKENLLQDRKKFPYINLNLKSWEPYRVKVRYILEKLENSIRLVKQVQQQAGTTTRPLLGQTLPGPSGYNHADELQRDINAIYESLVQNNSKAQARSMVQDIKILVDTFGLHMTSIDFRQTSEKNRSGIIEYLKADNRENEVAKLTDKNTSEAEVQKILTHLLLDQQLEMNPWIVPNLSKISRDTFETMVIFADAASTDRRAVGKFIISMCSRVSDIMVVLLMLKLVGMLETDGTKIIRCPFDVTGLLETIEDLKNGPRIVKDLLSIPLIRNYICEHRQGKLTVMMGYSDSVRDGSSLASDAQISRTSLQLKQVEDELNAGLDAHHPQRVRLVFYRGRGDTIPRGFGGSVPKSIAAQLVVTREEDHTEQNRFLRRYASSSSTIDHLHMVYSAHLSRQVTPLPIPAEKVQKYQRYFDFFGRISFVKWTSLVQETGTGKEYFALLSKYSILPHLPRANFASRPVARDGVTYNIESIRAIPFTMFLAQMREFTNAYYGTGTAFEKGTHWLENQCGQTAIALARAYIDAISADETTPAQVYHAILSSDTRVPHLLKVIEGSLKHLVGDESKFGEFIELAKKITPDPLFTTTLKQYGSSIFVGIEAVAALILETSEIRDQGAVSVLREMYRSYPPFQYSLQNKEASVLIRNKDIIDDYTESASPEEKKLLATTEEEARLTAAWVLRITGQNELELKMLNRDFNSVELTILHKIQAKFLKDYQKLYASAKTQGRPSFEQQELEAAVQMSILAISQALGFAG